MTIVTNQNKMAIRQHARECGADDEKIEWVFNTLELILQRVGQQSRSRKMINRIGKILLQDSPLTIIAPSCPDYTHRDGKYTFRGVGCNVPLLSELHIKLLTNLKQILPELRCEIVVADQEALDPALQAKMGVSESEFLDRVCASIEATRLRVPEENWSVSAMTKRFPDLLDLERQCAAEIHENPKLKARIDTDILARRSMYLSIGVTNVEEMRARTIRTAAQYSALAKIAARDGHIVCNHTTVNLSWFNENDAAVLHNDVSVY